MENYTTKDTEKQISQLFKNSKNKENVNECKEAKRTIQLIVFVFELIDVFNNADHGNIVNKLYFTKSNIFDNGVKSSYNEVPAGERTLDRYRMKYCMVIDKFFILKDEIDII